MSFSAPTMVPFAIVVARKMPVPHGYFLCKHVEKVALGLVIHAQEFLKPYWFLIIYDHSNKIITGKLPIMIMLMHVHKYSHRIVSCKEQNLLLLIYILVLYYMLR